MDKNWCGLAPLWLFFTFFTLMCFTTSWFKNYLFKKIIFFKIFWKYKINRYYYVMQLNLFWHYSHGNYIFNSWSVSNAKEIMTNTTYMYFINFFKSLYQCFFFQFKYLYSQNLINKISSLILLSEWWCHS